jgi:hypothetical protein
LIHGAIISRSTSESAAIRAVRAPHAKVLAMAGWVTIENIMFRGGPRDGERLNDVGAAGLVEGIDVPGDVGAAGRYCRTDEHDQLNGEHVTDPYSRIWFYDWLPASDA